MTSFPVSLLGAARILAVLTVDDADGVRDAADTLLQSGLSTIEITMRTTAATAAIRSAASVPGITVGAGTVLTARHVDEAVEAGAAFVVSPGLSASVVARCRALGVPVLPGVATSTELMAALDLGIDVVKFFPAEQLGGERALTALAGPFPHVRFVPTGGMDATNAAGYLALPCVAAVGGSWMASGRQIAAGDFATLAELARAAAHLGSTGAAPNPAPR